MVCHMSASIATITRTPYHAAQDTTTNWKVLYREIPSRAPYRQISSSDIYIYVQA